MTRTEVWLWVRLRGVQPRFRRQQPMGPFILDFYCPAAKLAVEVDGAVHRGDAQVEHDAARDFWLAEKGVTVIRVSAAAVLADPDSVAAAVLDRAAELAKG